MSTFNRAYSSFPSMHRSRSTRMFGGVCGGIARWLDWDPTAVRILYVLLSVGSAAFPGLLVYLVLWIAMPQAND
jgi:phage shock protein PspC (stress-responsive transcriptional regulator)